MYVCVWVQVTTTVRGAGGERGDRRRCGNARSHTNNRERERNGERGEGGRGGEAAIKRVLSSVSAWMEARRRVVVVVW